MFVALLIEFVDDRGNLQLRTCNSNASSASAFAILTSWSYSVCSISKRRFESAMEPSALQRSSTSCFSRSASYNWGKEKNNRCCLLGLVSRPILRFEFLLYRIKNADLVESIEIVPIDFYWKVIARTEGWTKCSLWNAFVYNPQISTVTSFLNSTLTG